jgi:hypothetical protein
MLRYPPTRITLDANELESALRTLARKNDHRHDVRAGLRLPRYPGDICDPFPIPDRSPESKSALSKPSDLLSESIVYSARTGLTPSGGGNQGTEAESNDVVKCIMII